MTSAPAAKATLGMFRALRNRNYRLYFTGQGISLVGTWMQQIALSWLTYRLTNSAALLGLVAFAGQVPSLIFTPFAGALADRINRHKLITITQVLSMTQAFLLAYFTLSGRINISLIIVLGAMAGLINALALPTQQAFLLEMVEQPEELVNAIGLNSSLMNATRLVGPALAGLLVGWLGEGICFLLNGLSYIAVIITLLMMHVTPRPKAAHHAPLLSHTREGIRYAFGFPPIRAMLVFMGIVSLGGLSYIVLLPVFAKTIFHGDAQTLGLLSGSSGIGALGGALLLTRRTGIPGIGQWITRTAVLFSLGLIAFSFCNEQWLGMLILSLVGFGMILMMGSINTIMQAIVDEDKRGRVMSLYTMAFMGLTPFGSLIAGWLGDRIGAPYSLLLGGFVCLFASFWLIAQLPKLRDVARPILVQKGFLTEAPTPVPSKK